MKFLIVFTLMQVFINCSCASGDSVRLVHVFFRHGSRTPELKDVYPNDPYKAEDFLPMGWGQLTNEGKRMSYKLGEILRKRYSSFLGDIYVPGMVQAISTDFDRTKSTALLVLAGLFNPTSSQQWHESLSWLPIPYEYEKDNDDFSLRRPNWYCPVYLKELEDVLASHETLEYLKRHKKTFQYISENAGKAVDTLSDAFGIFQTLTAETHLNMTLPEWTKSVYPEVLTKFAAKQCYLENSNRVLKRLNGGRMLSKVITNMVSKSESNLEPQERKIFLYSGHENNVINILAALNNFEPHVPNYSSALIIELHSLDELQEYAVKVHYLKDVDQEPEELKLEDCDDFCPLSQFIKITEPHIPVNFTSECNSTVNLD